jgi:hypothetical protein
MPFLLLPKQINMKKYFLFATLFVYAFNGFAQKRNEVNVSYGSATTDQVLTSILTVTITAVGSVAGNYKLASLKSSGAIFLTYRHKSANGKTALGLALGIDNTKGKIVDAATNVEKGKIESKSITIAAEGLVHYLNKDKIKVYGLLGAGYSLLNFTYVPSATVTNPQSGHFNFQVTPLGIKVGKDFGGFAEVGFGYKGLFNLGVFANF